MIPRKTEGDINIRIRRATNNRLKVKAAKYKVSVKDLIDAFSKGEWIRV